MLIKGKIVAGVKWTTGSTVVLALTAILKISILTRYLDKEDFGLIALVTFVLGFMDLFSEMGLTSAILHKQNIKSKEYSSLYWLNLFVSIIMYICLLQVTSVIALFYNQSELLKLIPLLGLNLIISGIGRQFKTIENKNLLFKTVSIIEIFSSVSSLCMAVLLAMNDYGVYSLVYSALLQYILSNTLYFIIGIKKYGLLLHFNLKETIPFVKIGSFQVGAQIINYFNRDIDILLIGKFFSAEILGGYSLARELVRRPVALINPILSKVGTPALVNLNQNKETLKYYYLKLVNTVASVAIPLYILIVIFANLIIHILYGQNFTNIVLLVQIMSLNMVFRVVGGVIGNLVVATGRTDLDLKWNLITVIITPIFVIVGVEYGIVGVAISVTLSSMFLFVPCWFFYVRKLINASLLEYTKAFFIIKRIKI